MPSFRFRRSLIPVLFGGLFALPVSAQTSSSSFSSYGFQDALGGVTIPQLVARIIGQILPLVGALFFLMFVWGGFQWFSAGGDESKVKKARQTLANAVIGMIIVMGAYILVFNIVSSFGKALGQ